MRIQTWVCLLLVLGCSSLIVLQVMLSWAPPTVSPGPYSSHASRNKSVLIHGNAVFAFVPDSQDLYREAAEFLYPSWAFATQQPLDPLPSTKIVKTPPRLDLILIVQRETLPKLNLKLCQRLSLSVLIPSNDTDVEEKIGEDLVSQIPFSSNQSHCFLIPHALHTDDFWIQNEYQFMHSISFLAAPRYKLLLSSYDMILKTDLDVFLTPALPYFKSSSPFSYGLGFYVARPVTKAKLVRISSILGLRHQNVHNIGATWFGDGMLISKVAAISLEVAQHMILNEFGPNVSKSWPEWWRGVISLYASELAVNHVLSKDEIQNVASHFDVFSHSVSNTASVCHIHCWHQLNVFSKRLWKENKYSKDLFPQDNLAINVIRDYCLYIALYYSELV